MNHKVIHLAYLHRYGCGRDAVGQVKNGVCLFDRLYRIENDTVRITKIYGAALIEAVACAVKGLRRGERLIAGGLQSRVISVNVIRAETWLGNQVRNKLPDRRSIG